MPASRTDEPRGRPQRIDEAIQRVGGQVLSPDGKQIAFVSSVIAGNELVLVWWAASSGTSSASGGTPHAFAAPGDLAAGRVRT